ncbi:MAG: hypothetical protein PWP58_533 [Bacillota bacterium]|nr:hypothetical protein [Bacillota bacterium]MDN5364936.1 hypothetical protein [Thermacetogenium sp.]
MEISRVQHLILLIGSNPLPNAVAGKLLVQPEGVITLVHSSDTFSVAQRLKEWLEEDHKKKGMVELKEVEESEPSSIYQGVWKRLEEIQAESIGLNYTGGTKMMSVHAYRAVEQWTEDKGITPVFSYLDARTLQMVFDPPDGYLSERRVYVGRKVVLRLKDFLALHGRKLDENRKPNCEPVLPNTARALAEFCCKIDGFCKKWNSWVSSEIRKKTGCLSVPEDENLKELLEDVKDEARKEAFKTAIKKVYRTLCAELSQPEGDITLKQPTFQNTRQDFSKWLTGTWLEHYVLDVLNGLSKNLQLHERIQNIQTGGVQFEVDVVAVRGYQLFAFSCKAKSDESKDGRGELKLALFEAYVRAQQLGGDEARVALVCCAEDPAGLEQEIRRDFDREGRVRVFGRKHLADLAFHIEDWIKSQSGEE